MFCFNFKYSKNAKRGSRKNPNLRNGDMIFVNKSLFNNSAEFINEITAPFTGMVSAYGLFKIINN